MRGAVVVKPRCGTGWEGEELSANLPDQKSSEGQDNSIHNLYAAFLK